jgi:hypothetical protein
VQQVLHHLSSSNPRRSPQSWRVQGTGQAIGESKEQHGWDPTSCVLEGEALLGHLVLLDRATLKMVDTALSPDFGLILARNVALLLARKDVEVVIGSVATSVTFSANSSTLKRVSLSLDRKRGV